MKKICAFILTFVMLLTTFFTVFTMGVGAQGVGETTELLRKAFSDDLKGTKELDNEGHLGISVSISTFYRESVTSNGVALLYVVGHWENRAGTDSDEEIIEDFLNEGYSVTVLDYRKNPKAVGNEFAWSVHKLFCGDFKSKKYDFGYVRKTHDNMYVVPSGCRIDREIYYFSIDEMALNGTNEYILWLWNEFYAGPDGISNDANGNDLPYAETIYDMIKPDGSPVDFDLRMDIVYPSNPTDTVPVFALASSAEERTMSLSSAVRPYFTTAALQGYAAVIYDHEYIPMSRQDHYKYYGNYTLEPYSSFSLGTTNANAVHSAAIRRIRYLADKYGYDGDYVAPWGFSKSGPGPAILANTKHEEMGEILDFGEYVPEGKDPKGYQGEQPWLYYEGTDIPISSNVTVAYSGSGAGICQYRERLITKDSVPIVSSIGTADTTGSFNTYISAAKTYLDSHPEIESDFLIPEGLGHNPAYGYDAVKQIEQFNEIWTFLDNHIRAAYREEAPVVMWATPSSNKVFDSLSEPIRIKFSRAMNIESVKENVKVIRLADGKEMAGTWNVLHGATTFEFSSPSIINASSYEILVGTQTKAKDGAKMGAPFSKVFTMSGDKILEVYADTYVSSKEPDKNFGTEDLVITTNNETEGVNKGLLGFKNEGGFADVTKAYLVINRYNDVSGDLNVYGIGDFDENTVTYNNAPAIGEKITSVPTKGEVTTIDVTDYVLKATGDRVNFALDTTKEDVYYYNGFENMKVSDMVYDTDYRYGGGSATMSISSDAKVGSSSVYFTNRAQNSNRIKFLKSFGTDKLTSEHLGIFAKASFWIKTETAESVSVGVYEHMALSGLYMESFSITPGEWNYIEYYVLVDQAMIEGNNRAVTVVPSGKDPYWLDDFKCELSTGDVYFASKEYSGEKAKISANLVLFTPEDKEAKGVGATVASGAADLVLSGENTVSGQTIEKTEDTVKGYLKFPIEEFDTDSDSVTLELKAASENGATFSIYGVLADDTRFAENFTKGITWNTALANQIDGNGVEKDKTVLIGTKTVNGEETVSLDVKNYVKTMKEAGFGAVTFIIVKENNSGIVSKTTFENMDSYTGYVASSAMNGYAVEIRKDPANESNSVLYMEKSGTSESPSGYAQNIALTGLIQGDDTFDESDIGKTYKVSFKQYVTAPGTTAGNYCNIAAVGAATSGTLLNGITKSVSSTATNVWNTVEFTINVNEKILGNKATAIIIASGWAATGIYIDDIVVEEFSGDLQIMMDFTPGTTDFEGITEYDNAAVLNGGAKYGITEDPTDGDNNVFYFERSAYAHSVSFKGLITSTDKFTASDVGKKFTVAFRQYNVNAGGNAGVLTTIGKPNLTQYFLDGKMTIDRYIDGEKVNGTTVAGKYGLSCDTWHNVRFEIEVTEEMVGLDCAIVLASNASTTIIYVDDIVVTSEGGQTSESVSPVLVFKKGSDEAKSKVSLVALINGKDKDGVATVPSNTFKLVKTAKGGESGMSKTYVIFNKADCYHIISGKLSFTVDSPVIGSILKLYAIDSIVDIERLTWNNAYGNDASSVGMKAGKVLGGKEIAEIILTDETNYSVDVTDALKMIEQNDDVVFVLTAAQGVKEHKVSDFSLYMQNTVYKEANVAPVLSENGGILSLEYGYKTDYMAEKVEFFIDGKEAAGYFVINGQIVNVKPVLDKGEHTAYAVVTYADGTVLTSNEITFRLSEENEEFISGDVNGDGVVDTVDLAELKLKLAGLKDEVKGNADCNDDGNVDTSDLAGLKLMLAGIE